MSRLENTTQKEDFEILQNNLKEVLITFNTKLDAIITSNKDTGMKDSLREVIESIEKTLNNFGQEMISSVVGVFNGISFDVEKQELKDFVSTKADDIKDAAAQNFANISAQFNERAGEIKEKTELAKAEILSEIK